MLKKKISVSSIFEKINNNFINVASTNIIIQNRITRQGIAKKTILLLFITSLFTVLGYHLKRLNNLNFIVFLLILLFAIVYSFNIGINSVSLSKVCSFIYSMANGFFIGLIIQNYSVKYPFFIFQFVVPALFATIIVFCVTFYLYYKGTLKISMTLAKKMFLIFWILLAVQIFSVFFTMLTGSTFIESLGFSLLAIPINLFMISFYIMFLVLHLDYTENMIMKSIQNKYEWQLSLAFTSLFIAIFLKILELLIKLNRFFDKNE